MKGRTFLLRWKVVILGGMFIRRRILGLVLRVARFSMINIIFLRKSYLMRRKESCLGSLPLNFEGSQSIKLVIYKELKRYHIQNQNSHINSNPQMSTLR